MGGRDHQCLGLPGTRSGNARSLGGEGGDRPSRTFSFSSEKEKRRKNKKQNTWRRKEKAKRGEKKGNIKMKAKRKTEEKAGNEKTKNTKPIKKGRDKERNRESTRDWKKEDDEEEKDKTHMRQTIVSAVRNLSRDFATYPPPNTPRSLVSFFFSPPKQQSCRGSYRNSWAI